MVSMSSIHFILYFQDLEGAVVSDRNGVCVIACAVEGKGAKLQPFMRCNPYFSSASDQRLEIDFGQLAGSILLYDLATKLDVW